MEDTACFLHGLITKKYPADSLPDIDWITSFRKNSFLLLFG